MSEDGRGAFRSDWRYLAAVVICLAVLVVVGVAVLHTGPRTGLLHTPAGLVNGTSPGSGKTNN